jgi:DNA polymerase III epsilon subunit-like protein
MENPTEHTTDTSDPKQESSKEEPAGMRYFFIDVETTGLRPPEANVCEIAWVETDNQLNPVDTVYSLIDPNGPIPAAASAVNGITNAMIKGQPLLDDFLQTKNLEGPFVFVAHNALFDFRFLMPWFKTTHILDTLICARHIYPHSDNHKLATLAYYLNLKEENEDRFHSADGDVNIMLRMVARMCKDMGYTSVWQLYLLAASLHKETPKDVFGFGKYKGKKVADVPVNYIRWCLENMKYIHPDFKEVLEARVNG